MGIYGDNSADTIQLVKKQRPDNSAAAFTVCSLQQFLQL